jgi:hypothetical protein
MSRLTWDGMGQRIYELGVDHGVLYLAGQGYSWPGLVSVSESLSGGDAKPYYIDGYKYANIAAAEEFGATIEAFSCPPEFAPCDGAAEIHNGLIATQQPRKSFGFSYRTKIGNDIQGDDFGYKIHLVYNALAAPSGQKFTSQGQNDSPATRSWAITTKPPVISGYRPTAHFVIDSRSTPADTLATIEDLLYGTDTADAVMPTVAALLTIFGTPVYDSGTPDDLDAVILDGGTV